MRDHTKLKLFHMVDEIVITTYQITGKFPEEELYGLTSQMRRAAVSAASNIVEECTRSSSAEYRRFIEIAFGSLRELHYQTGLARRLKFIDESVFVKIDEKFVTTEKTLTALIKTITIRQ